MSEKNDTPWEPPLAGSEVEHVLGSLDRLRATFRWKVDGLDEAGLRTKVGASSLTLGGLLKHLAFVEDLTSTLKLSGTSPGEMWAPVMETEDWEFSSAAEDSAADLYKLWDEAVERSRARFAGVLADGGIDQPVDMATPEGEHASIRRLLFDLIEEYGRHTGQADMLREAVDGRVGEDPPAGWQPVSSAVG